MKQLTKPQARKAYEARKVIIIAPCKCRVDGPFAFRMNPDWIDEFNSFDQMVSNFTYYNCNNEMGRYPRFYIDE